MAIRDELDNDVIDETEYPSNRKYSKSETTPQVIVKEPSKGKKLVSTFFQGDFKTVGSYLLQDILLPTIKDTFAEALHSTIDILINGESGRGRSSSKVDRVSYNKSKSRTEVYATPMNALKDVIFTDPSEAEGVLDNLCEIIDREGSVSVAEYYEACGQSSNFTDNKRGWESLSSARVKRINGGYIISLPKPIRF